MVSLYQRPQTNYFTAFLEVFHFPSSVSLKNLTELSQFLAFKPGTTSPTKTTDGLSKLW